MTLKENPEQIQRGGDSRCCDRQFSCAGRSATKAGCEVPSTVVGYRQQCKFTVTRAGGGGVCTTLEEAEDITPFYENTDGCGGLRASCKGGYPHASGHTECCLGDGLSCQLATSSNTGICMSNAVGGDIF